ncbi:MAG: hypothetical protein EP330_08720 [Deltaproteobacteria bacterium]|nr:MAG: hypothetical protein EP330_08720 [Deltaproteobacteria bacterium]
MEFHPEEPFDHNLGQRVVWERLKEALAGLEGHAYYRFPVFQDGAFYRYEVDVLLVLRDYGVIALEVKGCKIENISSIAGSAWTMRDWYQDTEAPGAQVDEQAFALRDLLANRSELSAVRVHSRVVVPLVARVDWVRKGFELPSTRNVWTVEDLENHALRGWLNTLPGRGRFGDDVWGTLCGLFQSSAPASPGNGGLRVIEYDGQPLDPGWIRELIPELCDDQVSWAYIVANGALERTRGAEFPSPLQMVAPNDAPRTQPVLVFHKVLRHWVRERTLRRYEERTLLLRVMRDIAEGDVTWRRVLEHDVLAWRDVLVRLDEEGVDLGDGVPEKFAGRLVRASLGPFLRELQQGYRKAVRATGAGGSFEHVARQFVANEFRPPQVVVLEGFTRLTALQHFFAQRCVELGASVVVVRPYRSDQARGFQAVRDVWKGVHDGADVVSVSTLLPRRTQLRWLQASLFSDSIVPRRPSRDGSVVVEPASHPNQEVASCVTRVLDAIEGGVEASEIVVATRDLDTYLPLLLEEAELQGCVEYFHLPARILLLTPVGRFALGLYSVWEGGLNLHASELESFLASGLLGVAAQETVATFRRAKVQVFESCRRRDEWTQAFATLRRQATSLPANSRLPAAGVPVEAIDLWEAVVARIDTMCRHLADGGDRSLAAHVHVLLDQLARLDTAKIREAERAVLAQIGDALREVGHDPAIRLSSSEFGEVLVGLAQAREAEEPDVGPNRVSVVGFESVDGVSKRFVLALGLDDSRVPRSPSDSWPLEADDLAEHVSQERYQFLALVRSASERLVLSWSLTDGREQQQPSMYLDDVTELLGWDSTPAFHRLAAGATPELSPMEVLSQRAVYDLEEIAAFRLCPHRYRMELLDRTAGQVASSFQLAQVVAGRWLEAMLDWIVDRGETCPCGDQDALESWLLRAMQVTEDDVWYEFPALRAFDRQSVEQALRGTVSFLAQNMSDDRNFMVSIERESVKLVAAIQVAGRAVQVEADLPFAFVRGIHRFPLHYPHIGQRWLRFGKRPADDQDLVEVDGVLVLPSQYDAVAWWWEGIKALHYEHVNAPWADLTDLRRDLKASIADIERGRFPKHVGAHCTWCPVYDTCLGVRS